jgi:hypothetical protein
MNATKEAAQVIVDIVDEMMANRFNLLMPYLEVVFLQQKIKEALRAV